MALALEVQGTVIQIKIDDAERVESLSEVRVEVVSAQIPIPITKDNQKLNYKPRRVNSRERDYFRKGGRGLNDKQEKESGKEIEKKSD